jgi:SH3-like domain-containing protein
MPGHRLRALVGLSVAAMMIVAPGAAVGAGAAPAPVPIELRVSLQSAEGRPLADEPVRLVLVHGARTEPVPSWQDAEAGVRLVTDAAGTVRWPTQAVLDQRLRRRPTNFFTQLTSAPQATTHLVVGVESRYLGRPWLVVVAVDRLEDGSSVQFDGLRLFGADAQGRFTQAAVQHQGAWDLPGVPLRSTTPGHAVARFELARQGGGWIATLVLTRLAEPVLR